MSTLLRIVACLAAALAVAIVALFAQQQRPSGKRGNRRPSLEDVLGNWTLSFAVFASASLLVAGVVTPWVLPVCLMASWVLSRRAPAFLERRRRRERLCGCEAGLDALADIVSMGVRAGLSFDAALALYCSKSSGTLACELAAAQLKWESGMASRERALTDLAYDVGSEGLARFSDTVVQALAHGSPLAGLLDEFARDVRAERRLRIRQQVAKVPVKMLVPTGVCILPAMLILVMGPALVQFMQNGI